MRLRSVEMWFNKRTKKIKEEHSMKKFICGICFLSMFLFTGVAVADTCCTAPNSNFPSSACSYDNPTNAWQIIDGLPQNTTIDFNGVLQNILCNAVSGICSFTGQCRQPGGSLGGEKECFEADLLMPMVGTGSLAGFNRLITLSVGCETHIGPRNPGDPVQSFDTDMFRLYGQLQGDPDFDLLRIVAGSDFGYSSPGHTTLTRQTDGNWNVDSFFDITYRIDFVGAPGGPLAGMSGSTTGTIRMATGCQKGTPGGGDDCYNVRRGASQIDFNENPLPAGFFGPGSDPFDGVVMFKGVIPDFVIVHRTRDFSFPVPLPSTDTVPIEIVSLNLVSCEPITVTGGQNSGLWNVSVGMNPGPPTQGQMTATKTHPNGGTFTAEFYVQPLFTFTRVCPSDTRSLIGPQTILSTVQPYSWQDTSPKPNPPCDGNGFYVGGNFVPGVDPGSSYVLMSSPSGDVVLELRPPRSASPYVVIGTKEQWQDALDMNTVAPVDDANWQAYMTQWQRYRDPNTEPYPENQYFVPTLWVWEASGEVQPQCSNPAWPNKAGLVMAWHDDQAPDGNYSAAWKYTYPTDPDLTGVVITVTVNPPCAGINTVSFGLQDINGNIRAWHWNVPGTLPCGAPTTITIDTSVAGPAAATPAADGYMNNPAFDITQVATLLFDKNCQWVGGTGVPPPGQTVPRAWSYWYDLIIAPKPPVKTIIGPLKWSQPPVELSPGVFLGWDEKSVRDLRPLLADDWACKDPRPVTGIHWWGSFLNWIEPNRPPQMPAAFRFGIWTDVPKDPNDLKSFSHPGELLWEYECSDYDYEWNFAGYDRDPRRFDISPWASTVGATAVFDPTVKDSCFQFNCVLPQNAWFHQKPTTFNRPNVYWLSIAAIYPADTTSYFPWGWKTRPHFFNDGAVRILQLEDGSWPPTVGETWYSGKPVEYPQRISWDMAFELTTDRPEYEVPIPDLNMDGIVDFADFAYFADHWLEGTTL